MCVVCVSHERENPNGNGSIVVCAAFFCSNGFSRKQKKGPHPHRQAPPHPTLPPNTNPIPTPTLATNPNPTCHPPPDQPHPRPDHNPTPNRHPKPQPPPSHRPQPHTEPSPPPPRRPFFGFPFVALQVRAAVRRHRQQGLRLHRPRVHRTQPSRGAAQPPLGRVRGAYRGARSSGAPLRVLGEVGRGGGGGGGEGRGRSNGGRAEEGQPPLGRVRSASCGARSSGTPLKGL